MVPSKTTINPLPTAGNTGTTVLGWKIDFPSYAKFEGPAGTGKRGKIILNKLRPPPPRIDPPERV